MPRCQRKAKRASPPILRPQWFRKCQSRQRDLPPWQWRFLVRRKDLTATERGVTLEVERVWKHLANPQWEWLWFVRFWIKRTKILGSFLFRFRLFSPYKLNQKMLHLGYSGKLISKNTQFLRSHSIFALPLQACWKIPPGIKSTCPGSICCEHAPKVPSRCCCFGPPPSTPHPTLQNRINCCLSANFQEHSLSTSQSQKHRKLFVKSLSCLMLEESCCLQNPSSLIHSENISEEKKFKGWASS